MNGNPTSDETRNNVTRRAVLQIGGAVAAAAAIAGGAAPTQAVAREGRPNILFILADDLGWKDVGFHGSDIMTPNIDSLAETGARLEQYYVQPMCTPTRAAFLTGRYPMRYGLQTAVIPSAGQYGLATDEYTLPQMLKDAGYRTALVGKWHLGHAKEEYWPSKRGFETSYGPLIGEIDHFTHSSHGVKDWYRDGKPLEEEGYDTVLFGKEAVRVIENHDAASPLFLYLAFTAPHSPYQAPQEYLDKYAGTADASRRAYAGQITAMDDAIGTVLEALDAKGLRENTLIFFVSDNGGTRSAMFAGEADTGGAVPPDNGPYRDGKGSVYEGGTRVVALANWPGVVKPGVVEEMMHVVDMFPTFAGLAGGSTAQSKPLDGMDVWTTISEGAPSPRDEIVYNVEPYRAAVRKGDMKLVWLSLLPPTVELFNLGKDPYEKENLAPNRPVVTAVMQGRLLELSQQAKQPLFMMELIRLGFSHEPLFPDVSEPVN